MGEVRQVNSETNDRDRSLKLYVGKRGISKGIGGVIPKFAVATVPFGTLVGSLRGGD
jgi:hypothetical protein